MAAERRKPIQLNHIDRQAERERMSALTRPLVAEFAGLAPSSAVIDCVLRCREPLRRDGLERGLAPATEAARFKLRTVGAAHSLL